MAYPSLAWLGRQDYLQAWRQLRTRAAAVADGTQPEIVWCCEHEPVYTTGRRGIDNRVKADLPAPFVSSDRGGETTFHGPGQLMLYPVLHLKRRGLGVRDYVALLEQSCIDLLAGYGIDAGRRCGFPGVWSPKGKVAALGVRVSRGVAYHGMALNVAVDPAFFAAIRPCGLDAGAVSMCDLLQPRGAANALPALPALGQDWYHCLTALLAGGD